jgi:hypothetical protein
MPCYRCGARQTDPVRGPSPWKRGVYSGAQILICPDCQEEGEWQSEVDRCPRCQSIELLRVLGETTCRTCGATLEASAPLVPEPRQRGGGGGSFRQPAAGAPPGLSDEVAAALDRMFPPHASPSR